MTLKVWLQAATAGIVVAGIAALVLFAFQPTTAAATHPDMKGHPVAIDGAAPSPATVQKMDVNPVTGAGLSVPSVGLNVPLAALSEVSGVITPPGFTSAYVVRNLGVPLTAASTGTVYVVMHSIRGGGTAPGNYLLNVKTGTARVSTGDIVIVHSTKYRVTSTTTVSKTDLPKDSAVWENTPGRLVMITCMQRPGGAPSVNNLIIFANLAAN